MAVKPAEGTVSQVCRVCGGEVNPHGECVVCGTKQSDPPKADDKGSASWLVASPNRVLPGRSC